MLDADEIQAMRDAAGNPRGKALFEFLINTGQRRGATLTITWGCIDLDAGRYRLNPDGDMGLKGAEEVGTWRPLLAAKGALATWAQFHPDSDDPDAHVFTALPSSHHYDPESHLSGQRAGSILKDMAAEAGIEKPVNQHAMRHNFVTLAKTKYDMANDVIKRLIGHKADSNVMQTTYAHLSDGDYIEKAEEAFGIRDESDQSPITPAACPTCDTALPDGAKVCPNGCRTTFDPTVQRQQQAAQSAAWDARAEGPADAANAIRNLADNPAAIAQAPSEVAKALNDLADALNE